MRSCPTPSLSSWSISEWSAEETNQDSHAFMHDEAPGLHQCGRRGLSLESVAFCSSLQPPLAQVSQVTSLSSHLHWESTEGMSMSWTPSSSFYPAVSLALHSHNCPHSRCSIGRRETLAPRGSLHRCVLGRRDGWVPGCLTDCGVRFRSEHSVHRAPTG
ncbi:hypothetical protein VTK56DRAFT_3708 [Thermocarpiscus australiensis]